MDIHKNKYSIKGYSSTLIISSFKTNGLFITFSITNFKFFENDSNFIYKDILLTKMYMFFK